jgi:hypothetical protein
MLPAMLDAASVPTTVVNWGGDEEVSVEEWCTFLADLSGVDACFDRTLHTIGGIPTDNARRRELAGSTTVAWRDGMRRMVAALS